MSGIKNYPTVVKKVWDITEHGGTKDVAIDLGDLPVNFLPTRVDIVVVTALVGATAQISLGNESAATAYANQEAVAGFDTALKRQSADIHDLAACSTAALRGVSMLIETANLTAGQLEIYFFGYVPQNDVSASIT